MKFNFNNQNILAGFRSDPFPYSLDDPQIEATDFEIEELSDKENEILLDPSLKPIFKRSHSHLDEEKDTDVKPLKKKVRWSSVHVARVLKEKSPEVQVIIDVVISEDHLLQFFKDQEAINSDKPRQHKNSHHIWSEDPEEVKEIDATFAKSIKKMADKRLLKNYQRLRGKQRHIFSKKRNVEFQHTVKKYMRRYRKELEKRELIENHTTSLHPIH